MAIELHSDYMNQFKFPRKPVMNITLKCAPIIKTFRSIARKVAPHSAIQGSWTSNIVTNELEKKKGHFQSNDWSYVENVLSEDFYTQLIQDWPGNRYFDPPKTMAKCYNVGFRWNRENQFDRESSLAFKSYPQIKALHEYLKSEAFCTRLADFLGVRDHRLVCFSFLAHTTYPGSFVAPHRDSIAKYPKAKPFCNIVFFLNGTGGDHSGGLAILGSNNYDKVIFEPTNLVNSCLIYDSCAPFYHGFRPVKFGKFRWSVASQFCSEQFSLDLMQKAGAS